LSRKRWCSAEVRKSPAKKSWGGQSGMKWQAANHPGVNSLSARLPMLNYNKAKLEKQA